MTAKQELFSWIFPGTVDTKTVPETGQTAPSVPQIRLNQDRGAVIAFLRHCGCPFAEKTFLKLRQLSESSNDVDFIAISHSDQASTDRWIGDVGGAGRVKVIVDHERQIYGAFGLGISSFWHVLNPSSMAAAFNMGKTDGINVRSTESGTRWQTSGLFAIGKGGVVRYSHPAQASDDLGDLNEALGAAKGA